MSALIDAVARDYPIDPKRVFATGISNGGIFSHYLAANLSLRIAAIAPVAGGIADNFASKFQPELPVSVLMLHGTSDPLVPYHGGDVAYGGRGKIIDTDRAVRLWVERDGCLPTPLTDSLPDTGSKGACPIRWSTWGRGRGGTEVTLYTLEGGGHTWPGGPQFLPAFLVGKVCANLNATDVIWGFFKEHPKA
jgi:polyhydroxybutyrate depolymerase